MRILSVVGARPNFIKIAPLVRAIEAHNRAGTVPAIEGILVHTGQHYDDRMSNSFFDQLSIPRPDINLGIGSGSHAEQVGRTMIAFEGVVRDTRPDWVVVVGDVNATCACSITAKKEHVRLAHIEAGLRSRDLDMPEEINRLVTDRLSDLLLTPDEISSANLLAEGVPPEKIRMVGNIMIDTLRANHDRAASLDADRILDGNRVPGTNGVHHIAGDGFAVVTLHRPSNVDDRAVLEPLVRFITGEVAEAMPVVWAIHPRTLQRLREFGLTSLVFGRPNVALLEPLGYHDMLKLNMSARIVLTDSGGLQEECCVLGTPCVTLRENTERPVTLVEHGGVSVLTGNDPDRVAAGFRELRAKPRRPANPPLWDGHTAERIVACLAEPR